MKTRQNELDVDFIGSPDPLTSSEEKALNEFFSKKKELQKQRANRLKRTSKKETAEHK